MMRSLWAGVSGLQAHQIAMDVEGNNIANVNTTGFKYSRANFSDLLSQTAKIATAPQGELGGKNSMQIGLGTQISSITKIFKQGSVQTTDKNTDLAIQGDGFFVVSPDGGSTYKYTRNGDFTFDAVGNFTDSNGYIIQGWLRDEGTGIIDATAPIRNITIPPGLTTPAQSTSYINIKANLNSGTTITQKSPIYALDEHHGWVDENGDGIKNATEIHNENGVSSADDRFDADKNMYERGEDFGALFDTNGKSFALTNGQGVWVSYTEAKSTQTAIHDGNITVDLNLNGVQITGSNAPSGATSSDRKEENIRYLQNLINQYTSETGVEAVMGGGGLTLINSNLNGTEDSMKNINLVVSGGVDTTGLVNADIVTAFKYTYTSGSTSTTGGLKDPRQFRTTEDLRHAMQTDARLNVDYTGDGIPDKNDGVTVIVNKSGQFIISNPEGDTFNEDDGDVVTSTDAAGNPWTLTSAGLLDGSDHLVDRVSFPPEMVFGQFIPSEDIVIPAGSIYDGTTVATATTITAGTTVNSLILPSDSGITLPAGTDFSADPTLTVPAGTNKRDVDDFNINLAITSYTNSGNKISENTRFTTLMKSLQGALPTGNNTRASHNIYAASHASSIDVFDSLGSKHTVRIEFRKTGVTSDGGTRWNMIISVPEPGVIDDTNYPHNILTGSISFNSDGSLSTHTPSSIRYTANNGSTPNQNVALNFGTATQFDGMTSFDQKSNTSGISQDGFPGGDLNDIRIDETGTIIGSFTNGRSFGLAQVAMSKFTNNEGLESDGGNTFIQTSNSGDPIIGQPSVGGRGFIQASSLEMSNVDLSRSLTQLIIIQRGYQANSKTITTSDQMLNTLLQLKQ
ncbi:MAG: flagellar hook protein FlgE [Campylobacteraceae bacterium]|nr:flagellar hook protein FlgE [Campylobacteraceae bacterium]